MTNVEKKPGFLEKPGFSTTVLEGVLGLWEQAGGQHAIPIAGNSMSPTIQDGDRVVVAHSPAGVRRGDVVVFWRDGRLIAHRVLRVQRGDGGPTFATKGDSVSHLDPPVSADEIVGRVLAVERNGWCMSLVTTAWQIAGWLMAVSTLTWRELYRRGRRLKWRLFGPRPIRLLACLHRRTPALRSLGFKVLGATVCRWKRR